MKKSVLCILVLALMSVSLLPTFASCSTRTSGMSVASSTALSTSVKAHKKHKAIGNPAKKLAKGVKKTFTIKHHKKACAKH